MQPALIVVMCVGAAVTYGVLHDQVTARVCVEYFTIGHDPNVIPTTNPTLLALGWGVLSTWWVGLGLGVVLAVAARVGPRPVRSARSLVRPLLFLIAVMAVMAFVSGVAGYFLAEQKRVWLVPPLADQVPAPKHAAFLACGFAHMTSYVVGFAGGGVQIARVWLSRRRPCLP